MMEPKIRMEVELVRHEATKTIIESIRLSPNPRDCNKPDEILIAPCLFGKISPSISITESDIERLYYEKSAQMKKEAEEKKTKEEKELEQLRKWKADMENGNCLVQARTFRNMRKSK